MNVEHVAWVPDDDPTRDWDVAAALAAYWVQARCTEERAGGVLVTPSLDHLGVPALDAFERRNTRTSRRASRHRVSGGHGPVLAYVPDADDLEFAASLARRSSLGVVETISFPLAGWAAALEAWNLIDDAPTPPLPDPLKDVVDRLAFYGNNGFGDQFGKQRATTILRDLVLPVDQQHALLPGAVLAAGISSRGAKKLDQLIDKVT